MPGNINAPQNHHNSPDRYSPSAEILRLKSPRPENLFQIVANKKPVVPCSDLITLTEKLAEEARSGKLRGLGFLGEYEDGYDFGLAGSYLNNPEAALLPIKRLERRIMDNIEEAEAE